VIDFYIVPTELFSDVLDVWVKWQTRYWQNCQLITIWSFVSCNFYKLDRVWSPICHLWSTYMLKKETLKDRKAKKWGSNQHSVGSKVRQLPDGSRSAIIASAGKVVSKNDWEWRRRIRKEHLVKPRFLEGIQTKIFLVKLCRFRKAFDWVFQVKHWRVLQE